MEDSKEIKIKDFVFSMGITKGYIEQYVYKVLSFFLENMFYKYEGKNNCFSIGILIGLGL